MKFVIGKCDCMSAKFCVNCGNPVNEGAAFCGVCGASVNASAANVVQPVYVVKPQTPGRGLGIASMVLGIIGIVYSFSCLMASFILSSQWSRFARPFYNDSADIMKYGVMAGISVYAVFGILAVAFGCTARKKGYKNGISTAGVTLSVLTLAMIAIALIVVATI